MAEQDSSPRPRVPASPRPGGWAAKTQTGPHVGAEAKAAAVFISPALIILVLFFFVPVIAAMLLSLTDFDIYALASVRNIRFVGLRNYLNLFDSPVFWKALTNTLYFALVGGTLTVIVSLAAAMLVWSRLAK